MAKVVAHLGEMAQGGVEMKISMRDRLTNIEHAFADLNETVRDTRYISTGCGPSIVAKSLLDRVATLEKLVKLLKEHLKLEEVAVPATPERVELRRRED